MWRPHEDRETYRSVHAYIAKQYYYVLQISGLFSYMDGRFRIFSILQVFVYAFTLVFHLVLLVRCTISMYDFNMVLFSQNVHFCLLMLVAIVVLLSSVYYNFEVYLLHKLISYDFYDYQEPALAEEDTLRSLMNEERRLMILVPSGAVLSAGVILSVSPIVDFNAGTFDFDTITSKFDYHFPLPYVKYPFYVEDGVLYYLALLGQLAVGFLLAAIIGGGGFIFINLSQNVCLQLKILNNSLDNIESRIEHMYLKLFGEMKRNITKSLELDRRYAFCYTECLRKNFEHHQVILNAFQLLEKIFSLSVGSSYFAGTIVIALSLISAGSVNELPGTTVGAMVLFIFEVGYMYLFSIIGQRFIDLSTELRYKMYNTRWYMCSKEIKGSFMIFQEITLKPLTLTVAKVVPANMATFSAVMQSAYSYYNLVNVAHKK